MRTLPRGEGFVVLKGDNSLRAGIAAVTSRIQTGRLKVLRYACPNLIAEAGLYRYPRPDERAAVGENPIDDHNHALAALRYLISRLDHKFMVRFRRQQGTPRRKDEDNREVDPDGPPPGLQTELPRKVLQRNRLDFNDPSHWTILNN